MFSKRPWMALPSGPVRLASAAIASATASSAGAAETASWFEELRSQHDGEHRQHLAYADAAGATDLCEEIEPGQDRAALLQALLWTGVGQV